MKFTTSLIAAVCALHMLSVPARAACQQDAVPPGAVFDFVDTDIRAVLSALAEAADLNITFGALPARPVTLRTPRPLTRAEILATLRSIAESNGLRVLEQGTLVRITAAEADAAPQPQRVSAALPAAQEEEIHVYRLRHIPAAKAAGVLQSLLGAGVGSYSSGTQRPTLTDQLRQQRIPPAGVAGSPSTTAAGQQSGQGALFVVAEELSNSLLVRASTAEWVRVQRTLQLIDIRPLQVLIDVLIAEVRRSNNLAIGTSITVPEQELKEGGRIGGQLSSQSAGDFALSLLEIGRVEVDVVLRALSGRADVSILSRPVILAQNNSEARILIGSQRPFIQVSRALPTEGAVRDQIVQYRDVGTSLTLTPTINPDGYVNIVLSQEISSATSELQFGAPVISTREASTTMLVRDGQTAVIGGLIDRQSDHARSGIPILKDIPLLGWFFSGRTQNKSTAELFLFLTPHVIRTDEDVDRIRHDVELNTEYLRKLIPKLPPLLPVRPDTTGTPAPAPGKVSELQPLPSGS